MLELNEFFIEGKDQNRSHVLLHITEPTTPEEKKKGYFFAVCEINNGQPEQIEYLQNMIDELEAGYYETDDEEEKDAFEITLENVNRRGHKIIENTNSVVSCAVGILKGREMLFAFHGRPLARLFYKKDSHFGTIDIIEQEDDEDFLADQLFSSVIQGKIKLGDLLYVASPHVEDYVKNEDIVDLIEKHNPAQCIKKMERELSTMSYDLSFGGLFVSYKSNTASADLTLTKNEQKEVKPISNIWTPKIETNFRPERLEKGQSFFSITLVTLGRALVAGSIGLYKILKKIFIALWRILVLLILLLTNKGGQRQIVLQSIEDFKQRSKLKIQNLPILSKILLILTFVLAIVFIGSLIVFKIKEVKHEARIAYENQIQSIIDKKIAAEASLIYSDDAKAFNLLKGARDQIDKLPDSSKEEETKKNELTVEIENALQKLRKIVEAEPELIYDLSNQNPGVILTGLAHLGDRLMIYSQNSDNIYLINTLTGKIESRKNSVGKSLIADSTPKEDDKVVFLTTDNLAAEYQKESGAMLNKSIDVSSNRNLRSVFVYNQKLYSLDTAGNQILKHNRTQTGYDRGNEWINDGQTDGLNSGVSIAIDGGIYILRADGEILKFSSGAKEDFNIIGLDPKLENPIAIWTYNDVNNIYILEPTNKRLVVLNKKGELQAQYTANIWQSPTDMVIKEDEGLVYMLDDNKIYKFQISK